MATLCSSVDSAGGKARFVADDADDLLLRSFHDLCGQPLTFDDLDDVVDVLRGGVGIHDDNHTISSLYE